jgi:hypothetical protein
MLILPLALNDSAEQAFYVHFADALTEKVYHNDIFSLLFRTSQVDTHPLPGTSPPYISLTAGSLIPSENNLQPDPMIALSTS